MDPFSITAGVAGLLSLTIQLQQSLARYIGSVKHAASESRELITDLTTLVMVLEQLERFLERQAHQGNGFEDSSIIYSTTKSCHAKLSGLEATLHECITPTQSKSRPKRWLRNAKWPLRKEDHQAIIKSIHDCINVLQLSLSIDGWQLLADKTAGPQNHAKAQSAEVSQLSTVIARVDQALDLGSLDAKGLTREAVLKWMSSDVDPSIKHNNTIKCKQEHSGLWFTDSGVFKKWANIPSFAWLTGIPGCGKTVLFSTIVEALKRICTHPNGGRLAYFYVDFQDHRTHSTETILRSITRQLSAAEPGLPKTLQSLYNAHRDKGHSPTLDELMETLKCICRNSSKRTFIVIDALDELPDSTGNYKRTEVLCTIRKLVQERLPHIHILCTSREELDIREALRPITSTTIRLEQAKVNADIQLYIESCLKHPRLSNLPSSLKLSIKAKVTSGAQGMFRWVVCQMETLLTYRRARDIEKALQELPPTLDATYARILASIDASDREDAMSILRWLVFAKEPMTLAELAEAAVARPQDFQADDRLLHISDVLRMCHSLVEVQDDLAEPKKDDFVRMTHYSVQEYLTSNRSAEFHISKAASHRYIGASCISYILHAGRLREEYAMLPLFQYAANYWYDHTQGAATLDQDMPAMQGNMAELKNFPRSWGNWMPAHGSPTMPTDIRTRDPFLSQISVTAHTGLLDTRHKLIKAGVSVRNVHRQLKPPEQERGTMSPIQQIPSCKALEAASSAGHNYLVELFLSYNGEGTSTDSNANPSRCPAPRRARSVLPEQLEIGRLLLDHKAPTMHHDDHYTGGLNIAIQAGYLQIMKELQRHGWRIDFDNALKSAIEHGLELVVLYLMQVGPVYWGNSTATHLPKHSARIGARELDEAMSLAARYGHQSIIKLLREWYGNCDCCCTRLRGLDRAMMAASANGHTELVRWLLSQAQEGPYPTAIPSEVTNRSLYNAVENQHVDVITLLIRVGADVNHIISSPDPGSNPDHDTLMKACLEAPWMGSTVVKLLLEYGAQLHVDDPDYQMAFIQQRRWGNADIVQILIEHGMVADTQTERSSTPMAETAMSEHPDHRKLRTARVRLARRAGTRCLSAYIQGASHTTSNHILSQT